MLRFMLLGLLFTALALIVIPFTHSHHGPSNESRAIGTLRELAVAEKKFQERHHYWASLPDLNFDGLVDPVLGSGTRSGYTFRITGRGARWSAVAAPVIVGTTGDRILLLDSTGSFTYSTDARAAVATSVCAFYPIGK